MKIGRKRKKNLIRLLVSILNKSYFSLMNRDLAHIRKLKIRWFKKGVRIQVKVKLGRKDFYLYITVNPRNREGSSLIYTEC
ncbi:hypothetical protein [Wolbachia endosymbiont of Litomosoides brasiliensis]|uniref:hypothetical protein n=1 Tax=Wolbachia endosymbiont of Litomosoides brasiliensis TaxID=1812117 RepID=UPI00158D448A|nr:hypothetical protein [Wolbachia endosymbiont of Litomosoides brasiliensis]